MMSEKEIIERFLGIELISYGRKLGLINENSHEIVDENLAIATISLLNELSIREDEKSKKLVVAISALLWIHRNQQWNGLRNALVLFLSRAGFGPSSIMIDNEYSVEEKKFSYNESILNQFAVSFALIKNEVVVGQKVFLLSEFQKQIWTSIEENPVTGISAPTSAGKSFLILLKTAALLLEKPGVVIYIVPTLSLVNQVLIDFRKILDEFKFNDYLLETTYNSNTSNDRTIFVLTQEKAISAFSQTENPFPEIRILVIDEIQNVEKLEDYTDQRSKVLYDLIIELSSASRIDHAIISGPRINKIDEVGKNLFGAPSDKKETEASPVLNLTYSISQKKKKYYLNLHSDLLEKHLEIPITDDSYINGYGKVRYDEKFLAYLNSFLSNFTRDEITLVFSPTAPTSSDIALSISDQQGETNSEYLQGLSKFIADTVHPKFPLVETLKREVAYHHGKLPFHVRLLIEDALKRKKIRIVVSTTTLLQGVNLPVQNIIIRNPNLFTRRLSASTQLTNYDLANLRGRAGRLLKDFVGRTFILDEGSFIDASSSQLNLFKDSDKDLSVGYGRKYTEFKDSIKNDIILGNGANNQNKEYSFLTTYVRQTILRHKIGSRNYLRRVGINLTDQELKIFLEALEELEVNQTICSKNRYWDPVDLDKLYSERMNYRIPTSINEFNISYQIKAVLLKLKSDFPIYYNKYFGVDEVPNKDIILQKSILAENWMKERTLREILSDRYYDNSEKIEDAVEFIQNKISYGLPLLLKPLYDIKEPTLMFNRFLELGAFKPVTRKLIELSIPRETAIYINNNFALNDNNDKLTLVNNLRRIKSQLSEWYQIQLSGL